MEPAITKSSTPMELLEIALAKEKSAYAFYQQMLRRTRVGLLRELAETLKNEEWKHIRLVERKLKALRDGRL